MFAVHLATDPLFLSGWVSRIDWATREEREGKKQDDGIQQYDASVKSHHHGRRRRRRRDRWEN